MEKPYTAQKGKEELTAEQKNKVSSGYHSPTATGKHVRLRGVCQQLINHGQVTFVTRSDMKVERRRLVL
nr:hypothetical protein [Tanacetum cinerariifolium]